MSWVELALKSTLVLLAAWLLALALSRRSAALRHLVWTGALAALLALPLLSVVLPILRLPDVLTPVEPAVVFQTLVTGTAGGGLQRTDAVPRPEHSRPQESRPLWWIIAAVPAALIWTQM